MSCSQDSYYSENLSNTVDGACGDCACQSNSSCAVHGPNDCPDGQHMTGSYTSCGECTYAGGGVIGHRKICNRDEPNMDTPTKVNCCLNQNLPSGGPNGYCASGWCEGSSTCNSFMTDFCQNNYLQTDACKQFCRNNPGACDNALLSYCSNPSNYTVGVCGCALPSSGPNNQYFLTQLKGTDGLQVPISCDYRCGVNPDAIRLQGQPDCKIGAICVADLSNVEINEAQQAVGNQGITLTQNCSSTTNNPPGPPSPYGPPGPPGPPSSGIPTAEKIALGVVIAISIIVVVIIIIMLVSTKKTSTVKIGTI